MLLFFLPCFYYFKSVFNFCQCDYYVSLLGFIPPGTLYTFSPWVAVSFETLCCAQSLSHVRLLTTPRTTAHQAPLSMRILQARILVSPPGGLPNPGIKSKSPVSRANSLPSEPPDMPKNTGVGSLSFLQGIFPTQELNWGLLNCRRIIYQLSYQGRPC